MTTTHSGGNVSGEPTMGEVLRRLDEVSRQLVDLAKEMKDDRNTAAATFVRQDVYVAQRLADQAVVADLHGDVRTINNERKADAGFRRQSWLAMAGIAIGSLVSIALALINFIAR